VGGPPPSCYGYAATGRGGRGCVSTKQTPGGTKILSKKKKNKHLFPNIQGGKGARGGGKNLQTQENGQC